MFNCTYCGKEITKGYRVGPLKVGLIFCNEECFARESIKIYPGTAETVKRLYGEEVKSDERGAGGLESKGIGAAEAP